MKAVIFDLDDTLFDHTSSMAAALRVWVPALAGVEVTDELLTAWFEIEQRNFDAWLAGRITHQGKRRARLHEFLPLLCHPVPSTDEALDEMFAGFLECYEQSWAAFPDARTALEVAQGNGWRIGVLTNGSTLQQNAKLTAIGLAELVNVVSTSEALGFSKPAREAYHLTCEALGADPAETLMIGDNLDLDVLGARAAGLSAEHLDRAAGITLGQLVRAV